MPLPIAHGLLGASIVAAVHPDAPFTDGRRFRLPLMVGALLANCPDADFLLVWALHDRSWHRGFTHSLVFALVVSLLLLAYLGRSRTRAALAYGLAFTSHGVLDFITTKVGGGVKLLLPFSSQRLSSQVLESSNANGESESEENESETGNQKGAVPCAVRARVRGGRERAASNNGDE
ncbi:MAG: metal-dependent hydrolase [Acidobacteria bacterium]|nr:metal-dependent hydrolase [Acidobacteriota bacterium]